MTATSSARSTEFWGTICLGVMPTTYTPLYGGVKGVVRSHYFDGRRGMSEQRTETNANLYQELQVLLNRHCMENGSNTPDFILAQYLLDCLGVFNKAVLRREEWYGRTDDLPWVTPPVQRDGEVTP